MQVECKAPWCLVAQEVVEDVVVGGIVMQRAYGIRSIRGTVKYAPEGVAVSEGDLVWFQTGSGHPEQTELLEDDDGDRCVFVACEQTVSMARYDEDFTRYADILEGAAKTRKQRFLTEDEKKAQAAADLGLRELLTWASENDAHRTTRTVASKSGLPGAGIFAVEKNDVLQPLHDWLLLERLDVVRKGLWLGDLETPQYTVMACGPECEIDVGSVISVYPTAIVAVGAEHDKRKAVRESDVLVVVGAIEA